MIKPVSFTPTAPVKELLERLVATGLWGRTPGDCVKRITEQFLWKEIERPILRLPARRRI